MKQMSSSDGAMGSVAVTRLRDSFRYGLMTCRFVVNWREAISFVRHNLRLPSPRSSIDLRLRDGTVLHEVCDPRLVINVVAYCHYSRKIGCYSSRDLQVLYEVARSVTLRVKKPFSAKELAAYASGGAFWTKEVVLFALIRAFKPEVCVETGVAQGVSSYTMLEAISLNGHGKLISVDLPNRDPKGYKYSDGTVDHVYTPEKLTPGWLVPDRLHPRWDLRLGRSSSLLPELKEPVDLFLHDSEHSYENMMFELEWAYSQLRGNGIIASDDIHWNTAFSDFSRRHPDLKPLAPNPEFGILRSTGNGLKEKSVR